MFWRIVRWDLWEPTLAAKNKYAARVGHPTLWKIPLKSLRGQKADQIDDAVGVAPLVVVPAQHFYAVAHDLGKRRIHDRRAPVALEIRAYKFAGFDAQNALQLAFCGSLEGGV